MTQEKTLPDGWKWTTIGEITLPVTKVYPQDKPTCKFVYLDISSIDNTIQKILGPKQYLGKDAPSRARQLVKENDVLFSTVRTYLKNIALVQKYYDGQVASTGFSVLRPNNEVLPKLLFYFTLTDMFLEPLNKLQRGTSYPAVRDGDVRAQSFPLPPLVDQERIVARIEELFTQLDAGVASLRRVQAALKRYKASVLKAACEGRLVGGEERKSSSELLEGWRWIRIRNAGKVQLGRQRAPQHHNGPNMCPYLRVANVFEDHIDLFDVLEMNFTPEEFKVYELKYGDILLNEGQSPEFLGRPAMYRGELPGACFQNTLIRFQAYDYVNRSFALLVFRHYLHSGRFSREAKITTNIAHLSAGRFSEIEFPLPPLAKQHSIVAEVERLLSGAAQMDASVDAGIERASRLRQAILKQAFEGRLLAA